MRDADNGVIINYDCKTKNPGKKTFDDYNYKYCTEVFEIDDIEKAFDRFKELFMKSMKGKGVKMPMSEMETEEDD